MNSPLNDAAGATEIKFDFSPAEYQTRLAAVRRQMELRGADVLLVDQLDHIAYLFGYLGTAARYQAALVPLKGEPHMVVRELDFGTFKSQSWMTSYEKCTDEEDSVVRVAQAIKTLGAKALAVEKDSNILTVARFAQLNRLLPDVKFVDFGGAIWEQRLIKSQEEIAYLERAAAIADAALVAGARKAVPGEKDYTVAIATYDATLRLGADNTRAAVFGSCFQVDSLHNGLSGRTFEEGGIYFIESMPQYRGYAARILRPVAIGKISPNDKSLANRIVEIQDEQITAMKVGATAEDVDAIARKKVLAEGLKVEFPQLSAYTLGYHAVPRTSDHTRIIAPKQQWTLQAGMVFHVVLHAYGLPFSETVLVTNNGPRRLTQLPRTMFQGGEH
ncbi:aminopeptidase P family protein [Paraburkholderia sp. Ac-20340]|uniref:M24 family metallopeptidase n=1 Tax=Paraburkholderia sp. Ac-20340 TaxID=2703888 RepID=UPI00198183F3|nr:Xaa-Pro peptidase family protein [Paraburkholderia sp. Ac-20340]MBN3853968.1 aminopeptidase P family protein [Paraburkholderia sp. Ac-20340]